MKLILLCDYGLDDAAATVDALFHAEADGYSSVDLVAVGGNVPCDIALRNVKKLVYALDFPHPKITIVDTRALPQPAVFLQDIHGCDGMGDLFADSPEADALESVEFSDWIECISDDFDLISLGPMTLTPYVLEKNPHKFIFMGGNINQPPNFHGYEFNHYMNREAFACCVKTPHVAITMDTCMNPALDAMKGDFCGCGLLQRIILRARELAMSRNEQNCYVWDDIAVKYLRHPDWFELSCETDRDCNLLNVAHYTLCAPYEEIIDL